MGRARSAGPRPWATRRWALPLLVALYRPKEENQKHGKRHKTPPQLLGQLVRILMRWFPIGGSSSPPTAATPPMISPNWPRTPQRLTLVSSFYPDANLVEPPPVYSGRGRPRVKGNDLPSPAEFVETTKQQQTLEVAWYGGGKRRVETVTGTGHWYKSGRPLVELRRVHVHDLSGTHRDSYFFTTDPTMSVSSLIETYTGRWNIETTFEEARSYLRFQTTGAAGAGTRCCVSARASWDCTPW